MDSNSMVHRYLFHFNLNLEEDPPTEKEDRGKPKGCKRMNDWVSLSFDNIS